MDLRKLSVFLVTLLLMSNVAHSGTFLLNMCGSSCNATAVTCMVILGSSGNNICETWYEACEAFCLSAYLIPDELEEPKD